MILLERFKFDSVNLLSFQFWKEGKFSIFMYIRNSFSAVQLFCSIESGLYFQTQTLCFSLELAWALIIGKYVHLKLIYYCHARVIY